MLGLDHPFAERPGLIAGEERRPPRGLAELSKQVMAV
jgi:hypothetical protein